ncbi:hypothetical protein [Micromonospora sp. WMMD710]|uniref:hypothetical protein n=1 Tax=Micromonospora sp. WMMD710 TaxID=3016085 RepID=UPI002417A437|nr:hypothetical protein [Micromonospora sp. WMMD710]MDG4760318.1 hypothetical protein [Micromonospora sp. WMMD710]
MAEPMDLLEQRIGALRAEVRRTVMAGDRARAKRLRAELRAVEAEWDVAILAITGHDPGEDLEAKAPTASLLPVREQVHQVLTFLTVPAAPKMIVALHAALFAGALTGTQLTSLRRDEANSFKAAPYGRPYYLCAVLTADHLSPARGLLAVSTWPLAERIAGPLSQRVHFLTAAVRLAEHLSQSDLATLPAQRLLWEFASNIPGGARSFGTMKPNIVQRAALAELQVHHDADLSHREAAARRALNQLDDSQQMFGVALKLATATTKGQ